MNKQTALATWRDIGSASIKTDKIYGNKKKSILEIKRLILNAVGTNFEHWQINMQINITIKL